MRSSDAFVPLERSGFYALEPLCTDKQLTQREAQRKQREQKERAKAAASGAGMPAEEDAMPNS